MSIPRFLTPAEVCELLNIDRRRLYRLCDNGKLHPFKFGTREYRYSEDDILDLVAKSNPHYVRPDDDFVEEA